MTDQPATHSAIADWLHHRVEAIKATVPGRDQAARIAEAQDHAERAHHLLNEGEDHDHRNQPRSDRRDRRADR